MANELLTNSNIYDLNAYIESVKKKHIQEDDLTLSMGIFGYLSDVFSTTLQNNIIMASEFGNEAIPTRAKFEKNIIAHALGLGIKNINARPAYMDIVFTISEDVLLANMRNDVFTFDRDVAINIGGFEFHTEYDILIRRVVLPDGDYVYTAQYDLSAYNPIIDSFEIIDPYLPPVGRILDENEQKIAVRCRIRQYKYTKNTATILNRNPIENKTYQFTFDDQLAGFDVTIKNYGSQPVKLTPIYEGLHTGSEVNYCSYTYIDEKTIRLVFSDTSNIPGMNSEISVNLYTTKGSEGNFKYIDPIQLYPISDRFNYDRLFMVITPIGDPLGLPASEDGLDKKTIDELKLMIPKEALARGSVTNSKDVNNFFNSLSYGLPKNKLYFFKKMESPLYRLYYAYLLASTDTQMIPTNTVPIELIRRDFDNVSSENYIFNTGNTIQYEAGGNGKVIYNSSKEELESINKIKFLYFNPFMIVINKSPLYASYYINYMDTKKALEFEYINKASKYQFICNNLNWKREYFTDKNTYKCTVKLVQNIDRNIGVVHRDNELDPEEITGVDLKVLGVFYKDGKPARWTQGKFKKYNETEFSFLYEFDMETDNSIDTLNQLKILNLKEAGSDNDLYGYMPNNTQFKVFTFIKNKDGENAGTYKSEQIFTSGILDGYSLTNIYNTRGGVDFMYNYSDIIESKVKVTKLDNGTLSYTIDKVPMVGWSFINTEMKLQKFILDLEKKRVHINQCLNVLEDSFGIDFKLFNTYGPSKLFYVEDGKPLNRTNLSLRFRVKFINTSTKEMITLIKNDIRLYIEDTTQINDLHIPNLITYITDKYKDVLVYFEFLEFNGYGPGIQHIYRRDEMIVGRIPEFLNVNTANTEENQLDIEFVIV